MRRLWAIVKRAAVCFGKLCTRIDNVLKLPFGIDKCSLVVNTAKKTFF